MDEVQLHDWAVYTYSSFGSSATVIQVQVKGMFNGHKWALRSGNVVCSMAGPNPWQGFQL